MNIEILFWLGRISFWTGVLFCILSIALFFLLGSGISIGKFGHLMNFEFTPSYRVYISIMKRCVFAVFMLVAGGSLILFSGYAQRVIVLIKDSVEEVKK
jgi:hypothetical protein